MQPIAGNPSGTLHRNEKTLPLGSKLRGFLRNIKSRSKEEEGEHLAGRRRSHKGFVFMRQILEELFGFSNVNQKIVDLILPGFDFVGNCGQRLVLFHFGPHEAFQILDGRPSALD